MECVAGKRSSNGNTSGGSQSHLANTEEKRFARSCDAVADCSRGQKNKGKSTAEKPSDTKSSARIVVPGHADPAVLDFRRDFPTTCREAIWLSVPARDEQSGQRFLNGDFQDKDRVLY